MPHANPRESRRSTLVGQRGYYGETPMVSGGGPGAWEGVIMCIELIESHSKGLMRLSYSEHPLLCSVTQAACSALLQQPRQMPPASHFQSYRNPRQGHRCLPTQLPRQLDLLRFPFAAGLKIGFTPLLRRGCKLARPKGLNPCSIARAVDSTNTNPRGPTNHAHNWNSNLRFFCSKGQTHRKPLV